MWLGFGGRSARDAIRAGSILIVLMDPVTGGRREAEDPSSVSFHFFYVSILLSFWTMAHSGCGRPPQGYQMS